MPYAALNNDMRPQPNPRERKPPQSATYVVNSGVPGERLLSEQATAPTGAAPSTFQNFTHERLLNAREVASRLGVSERWVRDHTTRRSPKIRGVKLGPLMRYRVADVDEFMCSLLTSKAPQTHRY